MHVIGESCFTIGHLKQPFVVWHPSANRCENDHRNGIEEQVKYQVLAR